MKHPSSREFFACWESARGAARAPDRSDVDPNTVRRLLGDIFVLGYDRKAGFPFRVAGTRVCALAGRDLKDQSFSALFARESRAEVEDIVTSVAELTVPAVASIVATSEAGSATYLELLLLPFNRSDAPISLIGLLAPLESNLVALRAFRLGSWRHLHGTAWAAPSTAARAPADGPMA